jgi:AraC-like DNA-binding protein
LLLQQSRGVDLFLRRQQTRSGFYRELAPSPDLNHLVACNWISVVRKGRFGECTPIIPDGCSDILLLDADAPVIVGPDTRMRWAELPDGQVITGLRLRPGALRAVFGCSAAALLDQQVSMRDVVRVPDRFLDALNCAGTLQRRHALLEDWVRRSAHGLRPNDAKVLAAGRLLAADPHVSIGEVAKRVGWNARAIHRQFDSACGYGPKHLQRVMRVQTALRAALNARERPPMSDIALSAGFADQAHMTREFRDLTGFTPNAYFDLHNIGVGAWLSETFKTNHS